MAEFIDNPGHVIALIGKAYEGEVLEPVLALDEGHVESTFLGGDLVDAYHQTREAGGRDIYLIRIEYDTKREKLKQYRKAYQVLEGLNIDVVVPANFTFGEYALDYPEEFIKYKEMETDGVSTYYELNPNLEKIEYVKLDENRINEYSQSSNGISLDEVYSEGHSLKVKYMVIPEIEINYTLYAIKENQILDQKDLTYTFNINHGSEQSTDLIASEFFDSLDQYEEININYFLRCEQEFVEIYTASSGTDNIYFMFDKEEYVNKNTEEKYFAEDLSLYCAQQNMIGIMQALSIDRNELTQDIRQVKEKVNGDLNYGKYLAVTPSFLEYNLGSDSACFGLGGMCYRFSSYQSLTNKNVNVGLDEAWGETDLKQLTASGFTVFYQSVRNGVVPLKALTLAPEDSLYRSLKNIRLVNEISRKCRHRADNFVGGNINSALDKLPEEIDSVLEEYRDQVHALNFEIEPINLSQIKINLEIEVFGEVNNLENSIVADIV